MKRESKQGVVLAVGACAVCCAGPILGVLSAIGLASLAGAALFGVVAVVVGAIVTVLFLVRRRQRRRACAIDSAKLAVPVALGAQTHPGHRPRSSF